MSGQLNLIHMRPDLRCLLPWAQRYRLLPERGQGDLGYAFHAALTAVWAEQAPQPFSYDGSLGLLAYSKQPAEELHAAAALATPELASMLGLDERDGVSGLLIRPFPQNWKTGQMLGFRVRVRPIVRKEGRELDAFLSAAIRQPDVQLTREAVYRDWLIKQLGGAAELLESSLVEFRLTSVIRRAAAGKQGTRSKQSVTGPEAVLAGVLRVSEEAAFAQLLARGLGRHRAFGFGMLLLKPVAMRWD